MAAVTDTTLPRAVPDIRAMMCADLPLTAEAIERLTLLSTAEEATLGAVIVETRHVFLERAEQMYARLFAHAYDGDDAKKGVKRMNVAAFLSRPETTWADLTGSSEVIQLILFFDCMRATLTNLSDMDTLLATTEEKDCRHDKLCTFCSLVTERRSQWSSWSPGTEWQTRLKAFLEELHHRFP